MWRSGSTFLWSRFRTLPGTCCFYEPLHHGLARLTAARVQRDTPQKVDANRHPALSQPYFAEFAPLLRSRGVLNYRSHFAYDQFILQPDQPHPKLKRYIQSLVDHASSRGATAVLGFNRTGLRLAWLKAQFSAYNIYIDREPSAIWASYAAEMAAGNYAFFSMWLKVIEKNVNHPVLAPLADRLRLRPLASIPLGDAKGRHRRLMEQMSPEDSYFMIYYLWLACEGHASAECDLVIETRKAQLAGYGEEIGLRVQRATGFHLDLKDLRAAEPRTALPRALQTQIEYSAAALFPRAALPKTRLDTRRLTTFAPYNPERLIAAF